MNRKLKRNLLAMLFLVSFIATTFIIDFHSHLNGKELRECQLCQLAHLNFHASPGPVLIAQSLNFQWLMWIKIFINEPLGSAFFTSFRAPPLH